MKRLFFVVILAVVFIELLILGLSDTAVSVADTGVANSEVSSNVTKASNSSASATITITMTGVLDE